MSETSALRGLKAEANTATDRPALRPVFLPRFWGSHERRWELGKTHLVPVTRCALIYDDNFALCGHAALTDEDPFDRSGIPPLALDAPIPAHICKKCRQVALKRGYGP